MAFLQSHQNYNVAAAIKACAAGGALADCRNVLIVMLFCYSVVSFAIKACAAGGALARCWTISL
jgi:hypothetical protein